jgi:hypothetical protein
MASILVALFPESPTYRSLFLFLSHDMPKALIGFRTIGTWVAYVIKSEAAPN